MQCDQHKWEPTGVVNNHAGDSLVLRLKCADCKQTGFRRSVYGRDGKPSMVVYTWAQE